MAASQVDLHSHTTASDGILSPRELVKRAAAVGIKVLAITDHDSTAGLEGAFQEAEKWGMEIIPGVELNTDVPQGEVHILGYFIDYGDKSFQEQLAKLRAAREERGQRMVERLQELGAPIRWERVLELAVGGVVARPHVAQALLESGFVTSFEEAFEKYIGRQGPAYVQRFRFTPQEAVTLISKHQGLAALAHPYIYDRSGRLVDGLDLEKILPSLSKAGLVGIEAYYANYPRQATASLLHLAERFRLVATGGSDYHGQLETFGDLGGVFVPLQSVEQLKARRSNLGQ